MRSRIQITLLFITMLIPWFGNADPGDHFKATEYEKADEAPMYCHSGIQISLNAEGFAVILPQMLLAETFPNYDNFVVSIVNPPMATDTVTCDLAGMTIDVMVTDTSTGNSCWSAVTVEDKLKPLIDCDTVFLACSVDPFQLPDSVGPTSLSDNCTDSADLVVTFNQSAMTINCMTGSPYVFQITRNYMVTDASGNSNTCTQIILFKKGDLADVMFPSDTVLNCPTTNTGTAFTGVPTIDGLPIANLCMLAMAHMDEILPKCGNSYVIKRKWTVTDWCTTLSRMHTQIIEVKDTIPPTIYCPADMTVEATMNCLANFTIPTITGTDACADDSSIMYIYQIDGMPTGQTIFNLALGTYTISIIGYDPCFNYDTCMFNVTVVDTETPVLTCVPSTVTLDAMGMSTVGYDYFNNMYFDNCGLADTMIRRITTPCNNPSDLVFGSTIKFCCADVGQMIMVAFKVTDINGNMGFIMCPVEVQDIYGPTIQCPPDMTIDCTQVDDGLDYGSPVVTAGCPVSIDSTETTVIDDCGRGSITRVFRATGTSGNVDSCIQIITIINPFDFTNDSLMFPNDTLLTVCNPDTSPASLGSPVILDNFCGNITTTYRDSIPDPNAACLKIYRIWEVFNACDTVAMFVDIQVITIKNNAPPVIVAPPNQTFFVGANCDVVVDLVPVTVDTCSTNITVTNDFNNQGGDINVTLTPGIYTITFTATNACGRTAIDQTIITVRDNTPPTITCPSAMTLNCPADTSVANTGNATAVDNCTPPPTITRSDVVTPGACANTMSIVRTFTAVDAHGNVATCQQNIFVVDDTDPVIACPPNRTLNCPGDTAVANTGTATATDECNPQITIAYNDAVTLGSCANTFTVIRTWSATDACGNTSTCQQTIVVVDDTDPVITCPGNMTLNCPADTSVGVTGMATATEECNAPANIAYNDVVIPGSCPNTFTVLRTWTAMDICGNASTCVQTLTVVDDTDPVISCPGNMTMSCPGDTSVAITGVATATEECNDPATISYNDVVTPGACANTFTVARTWTATDLCGNSTSCVQTIVIQDITDPVINCPGTITLDCPADTSTSITGVATATDECNNPPIVSYSDAVNAGSCPNTYTVVRTWTATDACGNTASCNQSIIVRDVTDPVITCPANVTLNCPADTSTANTGVATATDACNSNPTISHSDQIVNGNCAANYTINRTWTATDACGNTASCVQTIVVQDVTNPTISCPADVTIDCPGDTSSTNTGTATANDACGTTTITYSDVVTQGSCPNNFSVVRTWKATDACGNMAVCNQNIVVVDDTDPMITCPADMTLTCAADTSPANTGFPVVSDECNGPANPPSVTYSDVVTPGSGSILFTITRTWTVTDACGNTATCVQTIVVSDGGAPSITCPADITAYLTPDSCQLFVSVPEPTVSDDCGDVTVTNNGNGDDLADASGIYPLGTTVITYVAVDGSGNSATCQTSITVVDTISPSIICPADMSIDCNGNLFPLSQFGSPTADDNCMVTSVIADSTVNINSCGVGMVIRTFVATDAAGNNATCTQTITVTGNSMLDSLDFVWPPDMIASYDCVGIEDVPLDLPFLDPNLVTCNTVSIDSTITAVIPATFGCQTYSIDYTVTDSCNFDPNTGAGQWTFTQIVGIFDTIVPVINPIAAGGPYIADSMCMAFVSLPDVTASDNCSNVTITNNSPFAINSGPNASGTYPGGNTNVLFTATDVCGNTDTFSLDIFVTDTTSPELVCLKTEVQITDDLTVEVHVRTFGVGINGESDNCTEVEDVILTYDLNDYSDTVIVFDCDDVGLLFNFWVYAIDEQGNVDSCISEYGVDDPFGFCPSSRPIAVGGNVTNALYDPLEEVEVSMMMNGHMEMDMSDDGGDFMFDEVPSNVFHRLDANFNDQYLNGVTAYDLSILFRHIADIDALDDPYLYYAADVNGDKIVDIRDVLELRKLLLGIQEDLPIPSWTFYDAKFDLSGATNPFYFDVPDHVMVYHNRQDVLDADFIGVKSGDLDYSAETRLTGSDDRSNVGSIRIGQVLEETNGLQLVPIYLNADYGLVGGQMELELDGIHRILEVIPNHHLQLESTEINQSLIAQNKIRMVWLTENELIDATEPLFWAKVETTDKLNAGSWKMNQSFRNELFDRDGNKFNPEIEAIEVESVDDQPYGGFELFQNVPNPFKNSTLIEFYLPNDSPYELSIFDVQGAQLSSVSGEGRGGMNTIEVTNGMLKGYQGILYYRLSTENNNAVRKMIVKK